MRGRAVGGALLALGSALLILALVWEHDAGPWVAPAVLGLAAAIAGGVAGHRRAEAEQAAREELGERLALGERALRKERQVREQLELFYHRERDWLRQLRAEVERLHHLNGALGDLGSLRDAVLRLAMRLVEAEKGLLVSRPDDAGDLKVLAAEGFAHDPRGSALARRFASEVVERDTIVREDHPRTDADGSTPADREIDNLLAIPIYVRDRFDGVVVCANRPGGFGDLQDEVLLSLGDQAGAVLENTRLHGELRGAYLSTVEMLADAIEAKDVHLAGHSQVVANYVSAVADRLGLEPGRREALVFGSLLHDVGKLGISERILLKPATLTPQERRVVELHPRIGYHLLHHVPALRPIAPAVLHHHERFDGSGYPGGLRGEEIPLEARIVSVADAFSAMTGPRPYRDPVSVDAAIDELEANAGTQFDPEVVRLFVEEVRRNPPPAEPPEEELEPPADPELASYRDDELGARALSAIDGLTLLYSHRHLHELAAAEAERGHGFAVVAIGLTDLAEVNRREGYAAGDRALAAAAASAQRLGSARGGTACRDGGRWLAVLLPADQAPGLVAELREALPGAAIGAAEWAEGRTGDQIVEAARNGAAAR
jgi:HD-GYP domain-containing protein (c-di-GMP phosphodiesterase class II)